MKSCSWSGGRDSTGKAEFTAPFRGKRKLRLLSRLEAQSVKAPASRRKSCPSENPSFLWLPVVSSAHCWQIWFPGAHHQVRHLGQKALQIWSATQKVLPPSPLPPWAKWTLYLSCANLCSPQPDCQRSVSGQSSVEWVKWRPGRSHCGN